ncbi:transmembrane proteins 14C-domain-containing protein [Gorgonomyces haynaldii]|nr:transmembrane proteins 14C-domain-containing protein [Gorgonomyces haynaldii]
MSQHPAYTASVICTLGGLMGYIKGKSLPSLIAGSTFGALYLTSGYLIQTNKDYGVELAGVTSIVLTLAMGRRAVSLKPVPVTMAVLGLLETVYYGIKFRELGGV